jgi:hypothetical protein
MIRIKQETASDNKFGGNLHFSFKDRFNFKRQFFFLLHRATIINLKQGQAYAKMFVFVIYLSVMIIQIFNNKKWKK